jgi:hypothetical protein
MSFDLDLTTAEKDIHFDQTGNLVLVEGDNLTAQRVLMRLSIHIEEWELNTSIGIDYRGTVLVKSPDLNVIRAMFADEIVSTEGVDKILSLDLDTSGRTLTVDTRFAADGVLELQGEESDFGFIWS